MASHVLLVLTNPVVGREDAYNEWYDEHLGEILGLPGFVAVTRYRLSDFQAPGYPESTHRYAAVYEFDGEPPEVLGNLLRGLAAGDIALSDAIDTTTLTPWSFSAITDRVTAARA